MRKIIVCLALAALSATAVRAATPVPGGANQVNAVSGNVGDTVFNGVVRVKVEELREATAADHPERLNPSADQKVMVMTVLLRNGTHADFIDLLSYTLADKDDIAFAIPSNEITPGNLHIQQAAAQRQVAMFPVDKSYVPTKVLVHCATCSPSLGFKDIRFAVPSQ